MYSSLAKVLGGFTAASLATQALVERTPSYGSLVLALQAAAVLVYKIRGGDARVHMPALDLRILYVVMAVLDVVARQLGQAAFYQGATMPVNLLYRSASLVASALLGFGLFRRRYSRAQLAASGLVTLGLAAVSVAEMRPSDLGSTSPLGILYLAGAVALGALLGHLQQWGQQLRPHSYDEEQIVVQLLSVPMLSLALSRCADKLTTLAGQPPVVVGLLGVTVVGHLVGMDGIYGLLTHADALTLTLAVTVRKFASVLLGVLLFGTHFTGLHWAGALLCLTGSVAYVFHGPAANPKAA